jgi:DNA processing protein
MTGSPFSFRLGDAGYPAHLATVPRPPKVLHGIGDPSALVPGLAVIGSRKATPYGLECARRFASLAAEWGVVVISGGAIGCDLAAHRAALEVGTPTVVVLGCGADVDYPRSAAGVLATVRGGAGAVVSELEWGVPPLPGHFPARNRIIAGLASAVLVVEAALPSGTFSTADHALDAGRDVFAVPGSVFYAGSAGCNRLIRQGAQPITCVDDLRDSLEGCGLLAVPKSARPGTEAVAGAADGTRMNRLSPAAVILLDAVRANPMSPDRAALAAGLDARVALLELAALEALGLLARYPDGRYGPCSGI